MVPFAAVSTSRPAFLSWFRRKSLPGVSSSTTRMRFFRLGVGASAGFSATSFTSGSDLLASKDTGGKAHAYPTKTFGLICGLLEREPSLLGAHELALGGNLFLAGAP